MIIYGKNPVIETLKTDTTVEKIYISKTENDKLGLIKKLAKEKNVFFSMVDKKVLDKLSEGKTHQGVAAVISNFKYSSIEDILELAKSRNEFANIIVIDEITDEHNLGAIVRSADCFGVHGIIISKHRCASVTDTVVKISAGATQHVLIAKETNINDAIRFLKKANVFVFATDFDGKAPTSFDFKTNMAIVIGNEGAGIRPLTKQLCDDVITIPQFGKINSLNASVATGVLLYEIARQRH